MTYPVKYMPLRRELFGEFYVIIDTSFEGRGMTVCTCATLDVAHRLCKLLNEDEGYVYAPGT